MRLQSPSALLRRPDRTAPCRTLRGGLARALLGAGLLACGPACQSGNAGHDLVPARPEAGAATEAPADLEPRRDPLHREFAVALRAEADGWLVTQPLGDRAPFDEVLPSWNVNADSGFVVDVQVAAPAEGPAGGPVAGRETPRSPWMRIGDWGVASRSDDVATAFAGGKVAVDVLELTEPMTTVQLRFRSTNPAAPLGVDRVRASIVLTLRSELDARVAEARREPWPMAVQLRVPARSQRRVGDDIAHRICSPTSVAMVAAFHGVDVETRAMAEALLDPHFDIFGNWNRAVQGAFAFGVPGRLVRVSSWDHVRAYLASGQPVIASIRAKKGQLAGAPYEKTAGHLLVVTGLGPAGAVHVNDPAAPSPIDVKRVYQRADMETVWFANGGVAYVFEPRDLGDPKVSLASRPSAPAAAEADAR